VVSDERGGIDTDSITVTVEASGGVLSTPTFEEAEQLIFKIFPNPATTSVSIQNNTRLYLIAITDYSSKSNQVLKLIVK